MEKNREMTGRGKKRGAGEIDSTSEGYTATESSEYISSEDGSDYNSPHDHEDETTLIESDFFPDECTTIPLKIEIMNCSSAWRDDMTVKCTHEGKAIGYANAQLIYRGKITAEFWDEMNELNQNSADVAWTVFDRYGCLKDKFTSHPVHRGTGVWGSELDDGPLLLIEELHIMHVEWRRKGLGREIIRQLFAATDKCMESAKPRDMSPRMIALTFGSVTRLQRLATVYALVRPGWLTDDVEPQYVGKSKREINEINLLARNAATSFYRSVGFRRIGSSPCFAYSFDSDHRAHLIAPNMDFDPQMEPMDDREDEPGRGDHIISYGIEIQLGEGTLSEMRENFPIHHAATTLPDLECLEYLKKTVAEDATSLRVVDRAHRTLLHTLARRLKPESIRWLLAHDDMAKSWKFARDIHGDSPLDVLKDFLEDIRTKRYIYMGYQNASDNFRGFSSPAMDCLILLDQTASDEDPNLSTARLKYGCTCRKCIGGFLSPRMKLVLLYEASMLYDALSNDIDDGQVWAEKNDFRLEYVAQYVQQRFKTNKSMRQGYANIFLRMHDCLNSDLAPSVENVLKAVDREGEWPPVTRNFLTKAGDAPGIKAALASLFETAWEEDRKTGNGEFQRLFADEYYALSPCRNDREYKFVALACGLDFYSDFA